MGTRTANRPDQLAEIQKQVDELTSSFVRFGTYGAAQTVDACRRHAITADSPFVSELPPVVVLSPEGTAPPVADGDRRYRITPFTVEIRLDVRGWSTAGQRGIVDDLQAVIAEALNRRVLFGAESATADSPQGMIAEAEHTAEREFRYPCDTPDKARDALFAFPDAVNQACGWWPDFLSVHPRHVGEIHCRDFAEGGKWAFPLPPPSVVRTIIDPFVPEGMVLAGRTEDCILMLSSPAVEEGGADTAMVRLPGALHLRNAPVAIAHLDDS